MKKSYLSLVINFSLFLVVLSTAVSGLLLQIVYHIRKLLGAVVLELNHPEWSSVHHISSLMLFVLVLIHVKLHWQWYKTVLAKRLLKKNRQVLSLTGIFVLVAVLGFFPWGIHLQSGSEAVRTELIEIHDKVALVLLVCFVMHIVKRLKWFFTSFGRMNKK